MVKRDLTDIIIYSWASIVLEAESFEPDPRGGKSATSANCATEAEYFSTKSVTSILTLWRTLETPYSTLPRILKQYFCTTLTSDAAVTIWSRYYETTSISATSLKSII